MQTAMGFIRSIADMRCIGAYKPIGQDVYVGCGRCASCMARNFMVGRCPEGNSKLPDHEIVCRSCGLTKLSDEKHGLSL